MGFPIEQVSCEQDVNIGSDKCRLNLITHKSHFITRLIYGKNQIKDKLNQY